MLLRKSLCAKHIILTISFLSLSAAGSVLQARVNHYINLSVAGGEANMFAPVPNYAPAVKFKPGADAIFELAYELRKDHFVFGLGLQADYDYHTQLIDSFTHSFDRLDREGDEIYYNYNYQNYQDCQHTLWLSIPVYFGARIGTYMYILAGVKLSLPMWGEHATTTSLATTGTYKRFIHTIENAPSYGYYTWDNYAYKAPFAPHAYKLSPYLELSGRIMVPSRSGRISTRLGVYVEYAIPLADKTNMPIVDYSAIDQNPITMSQPNLQQNIRFNPIPGSDSVSKAYSQLSVGLKWTWMFNITPIERICRCVTD